jgi:flagellar motor switch/type III secretory pathway protein FliN
MHQERVRPFSLEGLPRLPRTAARSTRALARAGVPPEIAVSLKRLGDVQVRMVRVGFVLPAEAGASAFALHVRGRSARLTVEPLLALRLVTAVLGLPAPLAARPLGRSERGVLAATIATLLEAAQVDAAVRVALDEPGPLDCPDLMVVELRAELPGGAGSARLELPASALPATSPGPMAIDPRQLAVVLAVEVARTTVTGAALGSAEAGDTLVFEARPLSDEAWPVRVRLGACAFSAQLHPDGTLRRHGPLEDQESETIMSSEDTTAPVPAPSLSADAARALAAASVEIVAEVGRLTVRGDELAGLVDGGVLALGPRRPAHVVLRVAGRVWAHGELVAIDDELGVRITQLK